METIIETARTLFIPDESLIVAFLRGTVIYFALLFLFRLAPTRNIGSVGMGDILLIVVASEAVGGSLTGEAYSLPNGIVTVASLIFWNCVVDYAAHRWTWLRKLLEHEPVKLIQDGQPLAENVERQQISEEELLSQVRQGGVERIEDVRIAFLEPGGKISVVPKKDANGAEDERSDVPNRLPAEIRETSQEGVPDLLGLMEAHHIAAERLRQAIAWHEQRAAAYTKAVRDAKTELGGKPRPRPSPKSSTNVSTRCETVNDSNGS